MSVEITASVGRGGVNRKPDTRRIQGALNEVYPAYELEVDGICGPNTVRRIERFQRGFMRRPDGRIDPGGRSLARLNTAVPSLQEDWQGDSSKWSQERKLASLDPGFRGKVSTVLGRLETDGFQPRIYYGWRSVAVQRELVRKGHSKVSFSFHNAQYRDGRPRAHAVDIIDRRWAWSEAARDNGFWDALGDAGKAEGLYWGGSWIKFKDYAHLQSLPNYRLAETRRRSGLA
ncbi:MAG: M15 family metallopeptidase [Gammaproteobacteria bacterium]|jgi:peptidoglycan L-alanyl-D-glutamate endopeptidase CwlK